MYANTVYTGDPVYSRHFVASRINAPAAVVVFTLDHIVTAQTTMGWTKSLQYHPRNPQEGCYQLCCLVNRGMMGVNSLPKTVTRQRRGCDLNQGPSAPESSTLTTRLPSHPVKTVA